MTRYLTKTYMAGSANPTVSYIGWYCWQYFSASTILTDLIRVLYYVIKNCHSWGMCNPVWLCEFGHHYCPLYNIMRLYIRIVYIIINLHNTRPYQTLSLSPQKPDDTYVVRGRTHGINPSHLPEAIPPRLTSCSMLVFFLNSPKA